MNIRKKFALAILVFCLSVSAYGYTAYKNVGESRKVQKFEEEQKMEKRSDIKFKCDFEKLMTDQGYYLDEINRNMSKYIECYVLFDINEKSENDLYKLVEKGYDFEKLMDIYSFVQNTKNAGDIGYIAALYDESEKVITTSKYWIEEAYNRLEENKHGEITATDINYYLNNGVTLDEIEELNALIRKSDYTIKEMLDKRIKGKRWAEITAEITGNKDFMSNALKKEKSFAKLNSYLYYSDITGEKVSDIVTKDGNISEKARTGFSEKVQNIQKLKNRNNVLSENSDEIVEFAIKKLPGMREEKIKENLAKGLSVRRMEEIKKDLDKYPEDFDEWIEEVE